jgi:hypothetical protein
MMRVATWATSCSCTIKDMKSMSNYTISSAIAQITSALNVGGKPHIRKGYKDKADFFGVYSPEVGKVYLLPVEDVPSGSKARLRLDATKNNQQKMVKWARDYEI